MDPRSGVKDYVRLSVLLERHPDRSRRSFVVWKRLHRLFRGWYPLIAAFPSRGKAYKVSQSPVIPVISGEWIVSHMWHEILRLSPHLFWLGLFTHRAFSSAQDDDTRGRKGSHLGDMLRVLELVVLYYDTSSPLEKGRAKGAGWIHEAV